MKHRSLLASCLVLVAGASHSSCGRERSPYAPTPALHAAFGTVSSETGASLAGVEVRVADGPYAGRQATTDATGAYRLEAVAGRLTIACAKAGYEGVSQEVTITASDVRVDFRMRRGWPALTGTVSDAVEGSALAGVAVSYGHDVTTTTGDDGSYSLPLLPANAVLTLSRPGYWTRQVNLQADSDREARTDVLPDGKGFDLGFFDYVFRRQFNGTARWVDQPAFEVWPEEFSCETPNHGMPLCTRLRATASPAPASFLNNVRTVLASDLGEYTGGVVQGEPTIRTHAPGEIVSTSDLPLGVISFAYVNSGLRWPEGSGMNYGTRAVSGAGGGALVVKAHIQVHDADQRDRSVVSHELAHALGFFHPLGYDAVPLPSCMKSRIWDRPTEADKLHGRILYRRPPGNRSPDTDPPNVFVNLAAGPVTMHVIR